MQKISVVDPDSLNPDPWNRIRIQHVKLICNRIRIQSGSRFFFFVLFLFFVFKIIITIYLSLGLHKWRPSNKRSLQPSKENIQDFRKWNLFTSFYIFVGHFCPPGSRYRLRIRIRIRIQGRHWIRIQSGSGNGYTTLQKIVKLCLRILKSLLIVLSRKGAIGRYQERTEMPHLFNAEIRIQHTNFLSGFRG